jgi:hypothetical protein
MGLEILGAGENVFLVKFGGLVQLLIGYVLDLQLTVILLLMGTTYHEAKEKGKKQKSP